MGVPKPDCRVVVFVDYQNAYEDFRRAFCRGTLLPTHGQFRPDALAALLVGRGPEFETWRLSEVRAYLGRHAPDRNPRAAGAHDRQTQVWRDAGVVIRARPLQYLPGHAPRQKGVDVELAVDAVRLAGKAYDVGIIVSTDTDLRPALEAVDELRGAERFPRLCTVSYTGLPKQLQLTAAGARKAYVFRIRREDYHAVRDATVYVSTEDEPVRANASG